MAKFWLALFLLINANNLLSIDAHETDFSECGISDFEPNFEDDSVPSRELGTNHIRKGLPVESANSLPWMVTLKLDGEVICTGTIIGRKHILTAYHCVGVDASEIDTGRLQISYGEVNASKQMHRTKIRSIKTHPNASIAEVTVNIYGEVVDALIVKNDLAIIEVENTIKFTQNVRQICLFCPDSLYSAANESQKFAKFSKITDSPFIVAGWGLTQPKCQNSDSIPSDQLMVGKMRMTKIEKCIEEMQNVTDKILQNFSNALPFVNNTRALLTEFFSEAPKVINFCVLPEPSTPLQGDSGGPLMSKFGKNNWVQVGVTSHGIDCNNENPNSTKDLIAEYAPIDCAWIDEATNEEVKCIEL